MSRVTDAGFTAVSWEPLGKERVSGDSPESQINKPNHPALWKKWRLFKMQLAHWACHHIRKVWVTLYQKNTLRDAMPSAKVGDGAVIKAAWSVLADPHFYSKYLYQAPALDKGYPHTLGFSERKRTAPLTTGPLLLCQSWILAAGGEQEVCRDCQAGNLSLPV